MTRDVSRITPFVALFLACGPPEPPALIRVATTQGDHLAGLAPAVELDLGLEATQSDLDTWSLSLSNRSAHRASKPLLEGTIYSRGQNFVVEPGQTLDVYPTSSPPPGRSRSLARVLLDDLEQHPAGLVYLPPSYLEKPRARFPVIYMQDGQNLFDPLHRVRGRAVVGPADDRRRRGVGRLPGGDRDRPGEQPIGPRSTPR